MPDVYLYDLSSVSGTTTSPSWANGDLFGSSYTGNGYVTSATFGNVSGAPVTINDDDAFLNEGDTGGNGGQRVGRDRIEPEYSYTLTDPTTGESFRIYAVIAENQPGDPVIGFVSEQEIDPTVTYSVSVASNYPSVSYSNLVVCFAPGTRILTTRGYVPVQKLREDDRVETLDNGPQPVAWIGSQMRSGTGAAAPVRVAKGVLGNTRPLKLSQQHRVLVRPGPGLTLTREDEQLVPVKALVGQPGISFDPCYKLRYYHVLFDRHQVIWANGALTESLLPGDMALQAIPPADRARLLNAFPSLRHNRNWTPARRLLPPSQWQRRVTKQREALMAAE